MIVPNIPRHDPLAAPIWMYDVLTSARGGKCRVVVGHSVAHWHLEDLEDRTRRSKILKASVGRCQSDGGHAWRSQADPRRRPLVIRPLMAGRVQADDRWAVVWSDGSVLMDYGPERTPLNIETAIRCFAAWAHEGAVPPIEHENPINR